MLPPASPRAPLWPWLAGGAGVVLLGAALAMRRRRGGARDGARGEGPATPSDMALGSQPAPMPAATAPEVVAPASLMLAVRPIRAGLNLISATVEVEVTVTNAGTEPATEVRLALALLSAHAGQDADLAVFYAQPALRAAVPPFTLAPGEARTARTVAALAHHAIRPVEVGGRPILVPLLALAVRFREGGRDRQVAQAFAVGVERPGAAKLQPFRLDQPGRQYDTLGARPHGNAALS